MNKIILAIPVFVIFSYFFNPIATVAAAGHGALHKASTHSGGKKHNANQRTKTGKRTTASWYGAKFHGKKTASGQKFNMYAMTAAHKTLPLLSYVKVTNPENHHSVIVRINDRGPFYGKRGLDLSYAAAKKLGIKGVGEVVIKPLDRDLALSLLRDHYNSNQDG
jgi:rare lipoprotein A